MIRDPSDGSVKEINGADNELNGLTAKQASEEITSGLPPTSAKAAYLARLEASREWLKSYAARPVETIEGEQT